jgi:hypothetical protein
VPTDCLHVPGEGDGHPRPTDLASIALAKSVSRAPDWYRAARVPGPGADLRRGTERRDRQAGDTTHLASQLRDPPARAEHRYSGHPSLAWNGHILLRNRLLKVGSTIGSIHDALDISTDLPDARQWRDVPEKYSAFPLHRGRRPYKDECSLDRGSVRSFSNGSDFPQ